jgi:hypothetical protein
MEDKKNSQPGNKVFIYNHGKFAGPSASFTGFALIAGGIIGLAYSISALFLIIPGALLAFTTSGTIINLKINKVKSFTAVFGLLRIGKWIDLNKFSRFNISRVTGRYDLYSRGMAHHRMNTVDIRLLLINHSGKEKLVVNKFGSFEEAQKEMEQLKKLIFPDSVE